MNDVSRIRRGRPFKPGQSGNPGGRPKGTSSLSQKVRERTGDGSNVIDLLVGILASTATKTTEKLEASRILLDRGFGKAVETLATADITSETRASLLEGLSIEELRALASTPSTAPASAPPALREVATDAE